MSFNKRSFLPAVFRMSVFVIIMAGCSDDSSPTDTVSIDAGIDSIPLDSVALDAPGTDGLTPDTLITDARNDTKAPDATGPDAKAPDAKAPDAKAPDAKAPDATVPDAMAPDAMAPDAMVPDAMVPDAKAPDSATGFSIFSPDVATGGTFAKIFTCDGTDISPQLKWINAPAGTASFVLFLDDPTASNYSHWVAYELKPTLTGLPQNLTKTGFIGGTGLQGTNDFGKIGYNGPCPPPGGVHTYVFTLHAMNSMLVMTPGATRAQVQAKMAMFKVLGTATFSANFKR